MDVSADRPRREEYADQTRAAVIAAARQLFAENGFFQTKVEQIAKLSRVSPATVYAQCGGKQGLLRLLMDSWTQSQVVAESYQESLAAANAVLIIQTLSAAYLQITKQWGDVIRVVIDVAPHDGGSVAVLATAQKRHNHNLTEICRHSRTSAPCATALTHGWQLGPLPTTTASTACSEPVTCSAGRWSVRINGCWPMSPPRSCGTVQASEPRLTGYEPCRQPGLYSDGRPNRPGCMVTLAAFRAAQQRNRKCLELQVRKPEGLLTPRYPGSADVLGG